MQVPSLRQRVPVSLVIVEHGLDVFGELFARWGDGEVGACFGAQALDAVDFFDDRLVVFSHCGVCLYGRVNGLQNKIKKSAGFQLSKTVGSSICLPTYRHAYLAPTSPAAPLSSAHLGPHPPAQSRRSASPRHINLPNPSLSAPQLPAPHRQASTSQLAHPHLRRPSNARQPPSIAPPITHPTVARTPAFSPPKWLLCTLSPAARSDRTSYVSRPLVPLEKFRPQHA